MSESTTVLLGAIAGGTIFLGLPLGRMDKLSEATRSFLATVSAGILLFLFWDVVSQGWGLVEHVVDKAKDGGPAGPVVLRVSVFIEGFGIVGPLQNVKPSWKWLIAAGLVGGGPTFLGTIVGFRVSSEPLQLAFFALAAGAILFVVGELWNAAAKRASCNVVLTGIAVGFLLGIGTDLILDFAGG